MLYPPSLVKYWGNFLKMVVFKRNKYGEEQKKKEKEMLSINSYFYLKIST